MRIFLITIIIFLLAPTILFSGELQDRAVSKALLDVGQVVEKSNRNDHPRIDQYLSLIQIPKGNPYCAAAVYTWYNESSLLLNKKNPLPKTGLTATIWRTAVKNPIKYKIIRSKDILLGVDTLPGDIVIWRDGTLPESQFLRGHTALEKSQISKKEFFSIDANTSPSDILSEQREQLPNSKHYGGVFIKRRTVSNAAKMNLLGIVRVRDE